VKVWRKRDSECLFVACYVEHLGKRLSVRCAESQLIYFDGESSLRRLERDIKSE
jgi:hypothetical protein